MSLVGNFFVGSQLYFSPIVAKRLTPFTPSSKKTVTEILVNACLGEISSSNYLDFISYKRRLLAENIRINARGSLLRVEEESEAIQKTASYEIERCLRVLDRKKTAGKQLQLILV